MRNVAWIVFCLVSLPSWTVGRDRVPADRAPDMVPFGVYLSWDRTGACARHYGIDRWEDVRKRLDAIAANHVDTPWARDNTTDRHHPQRGWQGNF